MTPQEVFEYKSRWKSAGGYPVKIHSDLDWRGKDWCRRNLERHQWSFSSYTAVYQHTFWFENFLHAQQFEQEFIDWIEK